jgi:cell division protein FtsW
MNHFGLKLSPAALQRAAVILAVTVLALTTFGIIMLCSTSSFYAKDRFGDPYYIFKRQLLWLGIGLVVAAIAAHVDYRHYRKYAWHTLGLAVALLVAVLVFGTVRNGARRWLIFGPVSFQPSEFVKLALVVFLAFWLERMHRKARGRLEGRIRHPGWGFGVPIGLTALLAALIFQQPDLGTTLLLFAVALVLMWIAGSNPLCLGGFVVGSGLAVTALFVGILKFGWLQDHYQVKRIIIWWSGADPQGINFQQKQALLAFGSGGPWGVGLGESRQKMFYLPEAHTDFIFPIIGEELGLIATLAVVIAFCVVVVCGFLIAARAPDLFGLLLGVGIVTIIALQAVINIAVVTNSVPNKGMPLPFMSYGGSNLLMMLGSVGILLNISQQAHGQMTGRELHPTREKDLAPALAT